MPGRIYYLTVDTILIGEWDGETVRWKKKPRKPKPGRKGGKKGK